MSKLQFLNFLNSSFNRVLISSGYLYASFHYVQWFFKEAPQKREWTPTMVAAASLTKEPLPFMCRCPAEFPSPKV